MPKIPVLLLFGGRSAEHEVSIRSAKFVAENIDRVKFSLVPIVIGRDGRWRLDAALDDRKRRAVPDDERILWPQPGRNRLYFRSGKPAERVGVAFPLVHGTTGEDGCLPGLLELAGLPYVGCGVLGSAVGMDKIIQKSVLRDAGLPVTPHIGIDLADWKSRRKGVLLSLRRLSLPCFVKPSGQGSSIGISKVTVRSDMEKAVDDAFLFDTRVIVERGVDDARELEVAVLLGKEAVATPAAEIISTANFYDYSAKYESAGTRVEIPAKTGSRLEKTVRYMAIRAAKAIAVQGFCRVDFLLNKKTGELFVNEINTVPGMTEASAFPRLCEASGITGKKLITLLIEAGLAKFTEKSILKIEPRQYDI